MSQQFHPPCGRACAHRFSGYFNVLAALLLTLVAPGAFAQTHVANPYVGAMVYASPDYTTEVATAVATETAGSALANQMTVVGKTPTFVWLDRIAAIAGGSVNSGRLGLQGHINAAVAQANGAEIVVQLVIYDLPDRDCAALASNGELSIAGGDTPRGYTTALTGTGIQEYENDYITPIYNILKAAPSNVRFVLVIEDDSLPNIVTNTGYSYSLANCIAANGGASYPTYSMSGVYVLGIQYALNQFHSLPNAYNYLDIGHHGWLGWPEGAALAFPFYADVAKGTTAGFPSLDGIITNTANYGPTKEPYMTATEEIGGSEVMTATFYSYDPSIDEVDYAQQFYTGLTGTGFPSTIGFLIDTSRNGWGGPLRPTAASTSTVVNTFVDATKIDERDDMGQWCNQANQGIGALPTVNPGSLSYLQAYVWVKPPGESDGNYPGSVYNGVTSTTGDPNCDPAHDNALANGFATDAIPNSPPAGTFWLTEFVEDVQNAYPALPSTTSPGFTVSATGTTVMQGTTATSSVVVGAFNGFGSAVALTVSGLPAGVTASFSPTSVTGSGGSTLTFTATTTATVGAVTITVTGTSGSTVETAKVTLTVTARPEFTIMVSPTTLSLPPNTNPTVTLTVTYVGGLTGSVSLSASGLPSGVQANFSPSSLNASGTVTVNFTSQASTPAGTYSVLLTGTDGTLVNSATLAMTIPGAGGSFTLKPSATTLAVTQGSSGTDTITVTDVGGFTGSVTFTATGLPSGVTASFSPTSSTSSSVLTLTASSTATVGTATVTIKGTSGNLTATTTIALTVASSSGSFTLAPSASTLSVTQGKTATDTITITDVSPFTGSVTLAATGLPSGVTVAYGTNPTTSTSVLTFTASSTATTGAATVTIKGTSGSLTATTTITLTVVASGTGSACTVDYAISPQNSSQFGATLSIINNGTTTLSNWSLTWTFANGQTISSSWNGTVSQSGANVKVSEQSGQTWENIPAGGRYSGFGFNGTWNGVTNAVPTAFSLNGTACTIN